MAFAMRFLVYVVGGGALLAWLRPTRGLLEIVAVCAWIGACVAADTLLVGKSSQAGTASRGRKRTFRSRRAAESGAGSDERETTKRRGMRVLFASASLEEAEHLSAELRERGLHPMVLTQRSTGTTDELTVEIRLPESEFRRALPIVNRFSAQRAKS